MMIKHPAQCPLVIAPYAGYGTHAHTINKRWRLSRQLILNSAIGSRTSRPHADGTSAIPACNDTNMAHPIGELHQRQKNQYSCGIPDDSERLIAFSRLMYHNHRRVFSAQHSHV